jgi:hypothetical protein
MKKAKFTDFVIIEYDLIFALFVQPNEFPNSIEINHLFLIIIFSIQIVNEDHI